MNKNGQNGSFRENSKGSAESENLYRHLLRPILCAGVILLILFGSYEVVERSWLAHSPAEHLLHIARGVISSLIVGSIFGWMILRSSPSLMTSMQTEDSEDPAARKISNEERLRMYARWFITMRWLASLVTGLLILISTKLTNLLPAGTGLPLILVLGVLVLCNISYTLFLRFQVRQTGLLLTQAYADLAILTVLLHYSGGIENPLCPVMIFHVIIAGILFPPRQCYSIAAAAALMFGLLGWAEYADIWEHQTLRLFPHAELAEGELFHPAHQPLYVLSRVLLQAGILSLTAYFVSSLSARIRLNEQRLEAMAERAMRDRQLLERALETTGAGVRVSSADLKPYWSSTLWEEWFGCTPQTGCTGCALSNHENDQLRGVLADGQTRVTELTVLPRDCPSQVLVRSGPERVFQITSAPLLDSSGQVTQIVELAQEVTRQKQTQLQLIRAGKLAAVGELAGQVAHEVNNPIAIISAKASLLLSDHRSEMSPKVASDIVKMKDLAKRVANIAQGLLSYCRPAPGTRSTLDITVPVRKSLGMIEAHARKSNVKIRDELPSSLPTVTANLEELEQVFLNLLLNALDAMPGGGCLRVSADGWSEPMSNARAAVTISIEDTGCGIPKEIRHRVFDPFFTTKPTGRGTGLGLSICLGLIRSHGGEIDIESKEPSGTRVRVKLPASSAAVRIEETTL